jgi:hypothetical protein
MARPQGTTWSCPCSFCRTFTSQHSFDLVALRQLRTAGGPSLSAADLRAGGRLADVTPCSASEAAWSDDRPKRHGSATTTGCSA